jgi:hypothetical protein
MMRFGEEDIIETGYAYAYIRKFPPLWRIVIIVMGGHGVLQDA